MILTFCTIIERSDLGWVLEGSMNSSGLEKLISLLNQRCNGKLGKLVVGRVLVINFEDKELGRHGMEY